MPGLPDLSNILPSGLAITALVAALSLSLASGLRAYLPLLAVLVGHSIDPTVIQLSPPFQQFINQVGAPWIITVLAILVAGETLIDKIPIIDHLSDLFHTIVRPVAGGIVMAAIANPISNTHPWAAAIIGGGLALIVHSTKAVARPAATLTTAGLANPVISIAEDFLVVAISILAIAAPYIAIILIILLALVAVRLVIALFRRARRVGGRRGNPPAPARTAGTAGSGDTTIPLGGGLV
jgi:hypothetical protein